MNEKKMYRRIRNFCGFLGMILPWLALLSAGLVAEKPGPSWWHSISATYYQTPALAAILTAAAIVLMTYDGYSAIDNVITTLAGAFGALVVLFPCKASWLEDTARVGFFQVPMGVSAIIHNASAAAFFILLAINCLFLFTKHDKAAGMTAQKKTRNKVYIACGAGMAASLALIVILQLFLPGWVALIGETLALQFFGFAWLVKGGLFFKDKEAETPAGEDAGAEAAGQGE